jgi:hypothetical protein
VVIHNIYASPVIIIRVIKSRRMRWAGYAASMGEMRNTIFWLENPKVIDRLEDLGVDEKIILKWILGTWDGKG